MIKHACQMFLNAITFKFRSASFFFFGSFYFLIKELTFFFPMHGCSDLSYNNFTQQGPDQPACQENLSVYL
jgi:hypothetical protein